MFDEIDSSSKVLEQRQDNSKVEPVKTIINDDQIIKDTLIINALANLSNDKNNTQNTQNILPTTKLTIGSVLSKLDGIGNYNGMMIVATTNHIENLDSALYRELRLTPINFTYLRQIDACEIIEKFFNIKLTIQQKDLIPDRKITPAKLIFLCEKYENTLMDDFIKENFIY